MERNVVRISTNLSEKSLEFKKLSKKQFEFKKFGGKMTRV